MCDVWLAITILLGWNVWGEDGDPSDLRLEWPLPLQIYSPGIQVSLRAVTPFIKLKFRISWVRAAKWLMLLSKYRQEDQEVDIILSYITSLSQPGPHETLKASYGIEYQNPWGTQWKQKGKHNSFKELNILVCLRAFTQQTRHLRTE